VFPSRRVSEKIFPRAVISTCCLLLAGSMFFSLFEPEGGGSKILPNFINFCQTSRQLSPLFIEMNLVKL
jgi:hypothetical protein